MQKERGSEIVIGFPCAAAEFDRWSDLFMRERLRSGYGKGIDVHIVSIAGWTARAVLGVSGGEMEYPKKRRWGF